MVKPLYSVYVSGVTLGSLTEGRFDQYLEAGVHLGTYDSLKQANERLEYMKKFISEKKAIMASSIKSDWILVKADNNICWMAWSRACLPDSQGNDYYRAYIWIKQKSLNQDDDEFLDDLI